MGTLWPSKRNEQRRATDKEYIGERARGMAPVISMIPSGTLAHGTWHIMGSHSGDTSMLSYISLAVV